MGMVPLSPIDAKDLAVDRCPLCEGFWLDSGELEKMQDVADILDQQGSLDVIYDQRPELLSNVVYSKLTLGGFPAVDCAFINTVDELHAGNHISELPEST